MLQEVLLVLMGHESDLFIPQLDSPVPFKRIDDQIPFIHSSDKILINEICRLGAYYHYLQNFCNYYKHLNPIIVKYSLQQSQQQQQSFSMYKKAMTKVLEEILDSYIKILLKVEQEFLQNILLDASQRMVPLTYLKHLLSDYEILFPELFQIIFTIEKEQMRGGELLDFLYSKSNTGISLIKIAIEKLLQDCHVVLLKHITSWILHGQLFDPYSEFFIVTTQWNNSNDKNRENDFTNEWDKKYKVNSAMFPNYLSFRIAKKILFVGKAILVLQSTIPQFELNQFAELLKNHEKESLTHSLSFEYTMDTIKNSVGKYLWSFICVDSKLITHLLFLKEFYLLSKGEFFQCFMEEAKCIMSSKPSKNPEHDLKIVFGKAARKTNCDEMELFKNLELKLQTNSVKEVSSIQLFTFWNQLCLEFQVKWPLNLLIDHYALSKYNSLFSFLFQVKRIQIEIQSIWPILIQNKRNISTLGILLLRSNMEYFVNSLQFYLHVDVIEVQYSQLIQKIEKCEEYEMARRIHDEYLANLLLQCFVPFVANKETVQQTEEITTDEMKQHNNTSSSSSGQSFDISVGLNLRRQIMNQLEIIFKKCIQLVVLVKNEEMNSFSTDSVTLNDTVKQLEQEWKFELSLLFKILFSSKLISAHLQQLLLRLDFNKFYGI